MLADILFVLFAAGILAGAGLVIAARNPMVSVLGMMLTFVNAAGLFILLQAEFLGLLLIMVYVGAIAVMFLFVLMTIDIDFDTLKEGFAPYLPFGLVAAGGLLALLVMAGLSGGMPSPATNPDAPDNIIALGRVLFTDYALPFQLAGLVLLTAMVGAIVLTHRGGGRSVRRQDIGAQIMREKADAVTITKPKIGAGVTPEHWSPKPVEKTTKSRG